MYGLNAPSLPLEERKKATKGYVITFFYAALTIHLLPYAITAAPRILRWTWDKLVSQTK